MARTKNVYLTSDEIYEEWKQWKETGVISERMGKQMMTLAQNVITSHHFSGYSKEMRDDMISDGVMKIIKNLHNMKEEYKSSFFSYWTRCCWTAFIVYLSKHYKNINRKKQLMIDYLEEMRTTNPLLNQGIINNLQKELEQYESHNEEDEEEE